MIQNVSRLDFENFLESSNVKTFSILRLTTNTFPNLDECKDTVMSMKSNKPPGLDGLPVEFYPCFFGSAIFIFKEIFQSDEMIHFIFNKMVKYI